MLNSIESTLLKRIEFPSLLIIFFTPEQRIQYVNAMVHGAIFLCTSVEWNRVFLHGNEGSKSTN
jgi:hypothetical protein